MSRYVLDSTVLIEFSRGVEPTTARVLELLEAKAELFVSAVQLAEFYSGAAFGTLPEIDAFLGRLHFVPLSREIAVMAGTFRHDALSMGRRLATPDALIAALARNLSATLLTNNIRDFSTTTIAIEQLGGTSSPA